LAGYLEHVAFRIHKNGTSYPASANPIHTQEVNLVEDSLSLAEDQLQGAIRSVGGSWVENNLCSLPG
jgi:uncharacterized protein (DUF2342 family)